jgi:large subunit ribosomal protein L5
MKKIQSSVNNRFYIHYKQTVCHDLLLKQNIENILQIPKLEKIILNTTSKVIKADKKNIIPGLVALELLSGQKQKTTAAHKSISGFKLRENQLIGCKVTLRGETMFHFLEKLVTIILPRIRHFKPIDVNIFDGKGNLSLGLSPLLIVPELESHFEYFAFIRGININLITTASCCLQSSKFGLLQSNELIKDPAKQIDKKASLLLTGFQLPAIQQN